MKKITLLCLVFLASWWHVEAQIAPIEVSGFTEDIVANGTGPMNGSTSNAADAASFCLFSLDWILNAGDPAMTVGLPTDGQIISADIAGLEYQIPSAATPYEVNNSLQIDQSGAANAGTMTFTTPASYSSLYFLVFSGNGNANMDVTVNFSDATSETFSNKIVPDWFSTGLPVEIQGFGRAGRDNNVIETPIDNPKLFRLQVDISVLNQTKNISSVTFTRTNAAGEDAVFNLLAMSGMETSSCLPAFDVVVSNTSQTGADVSWGTVPGVTEWEIEYGEVDFVLGTGTVVLDDDGVAGETLTALASGTQYDLYVRSVCGATEESTPIGVSFHTLLCEPSAQCNYTFQLTDDYGDGWNGNTMNVTQNGIFVATLTLTDGATADVLVPICDGVPFELSWNLGGSYASEVAINVVDPSGATIYTKPINTGAPGDELFTSTGDCSAAGCDQPSDLAVSNIMTTSVDLEWSQVGTVSLWDVNVVLAGDPLPTTPTYAGVSTNSYPVTGLISASDYEFYVRADCGAGVFSNWSGPYEFSTACDPFGDFTENFDAVVADELPNCWGKITNTTSTFVTVGVAEFGSFSAPKNLEMSNGGDASAELFLISPPLTDLALSTHQMRFFATKGGAVLLEVGTLSDPNDASTFTLVSTINLTGEYTEYMVQFDAPTTDVYVAFRATYTGTYANVNIDDVAWESIPACPQPNDLTATGITTNSANLGWIETGSATSWGIELGEAGFLPTGTPTTAGVTNPINVTNLSTNTDYEFYVRSDCGGGDYSDWSGPYAFSTVCEAYGDFTENFDALSYDEIPNCWSRLVNSTSEYASVGVVTFNSNSEPNTLSMGNSGDASAELFLITPMLTGLPPGTNRMRFFASGPSEGQLILEIGTMTDPADAASFTMVETIATINNYQEFVVFFNETTTDNYVAFRATFNNAYNSVRIDDITWEPIPSCPMPQDLAATVIDQTSVELSWTEIGSATTWDIEYGIDGFVSTGTPTETVTSNPYALTNLQAGANYDYYVRANCGPGDVSFWVGPFEFSTLCNALEIPGYLEEFTFFPNCWQEAEAGTPEEGPSDIGAGPWFSDEFLNTGDNLSASIYMFGNVMSGWMISPDIDLSGGNYELTYIAAITDYFNSNPPEGNGMGTDDEIKVLISEDDGVTWETLKIYNQAAFPSATGDAEIISLSGYEGTVNIAFWATEGTVDDPEAYDVFIDDFEIRTVIITCAEPTNLAVTNISFDSADLSWEVVGNASEGYEWFIFEAGADPATATPVATGTTTTGITTAAATGLNPETDYDFYVLANCGATDGMSILAGPEPFTTTELGVSNDTFEGFSYYPNPTPGTLRLKAMKEIQQVVIYNMLGKQLLKIQPNSLFPVLELSTLQMGTYFMKVTIDNTVGVYRIIKK